MNQEKLQSLVNYLNSLKDKLSSPVPESHQNHPSTYKAYLNNEIRMTTKKIEEGKLVGVK